MDVYKLFETIQARALLNEARALDMDLRLVRMILELYRQPRRPRAVGSVSESAVAYQGILAGCSNA
eukprot:5621233-Pyramimonas_sp.AAC.1